MSLLRTKRDQPDDWRALCDAWKDDEAHAAERADDLVTLERARHFNGARRARDEAHAALECAQAHADEALTLAVALVARADKVYEDARKGLRRAAES